MPGDKHSSQVDDVFAPSRRAVAVTPHDTTLLGTIPKALYVGVGGTVVALLADDTTPVTFTNVGSGAILPVRVQKVLLTGTTASGILALS